MFRAKKKQQQWLWYGTLVQCQFSVWAVFVVSCFCLALSARGFNSLCSVFFAIHVTLKTRQSMKCATVVHWAMSAKCKFFRGLSCTIILNRMRIWRASHCRHNLSCSWCAAIKMVVQKYRFAFLVATSSYSWRKTSKINSNANKRQR